MRLVSLARASCLAGARPSTKGTSVSICDVHGTAWHAMAPRHDNGVLIASLFFLLSLSLFLSHFGGDPLCARSRLVVSSLVVVPDDGQRGTATCRTLAKEGKKKTRCRPDNGCSCLSSPSAASNNRTKACSLCPSPFLPLFFVAHIARVRCIHRRPTVERTQRPIDRQRRLPTPCTDNRPTRQLKRKVQETAACLLYPFDIQ